MKTGVYLNPSSEEVEVEHQELKVILGYIEFEVSLDYVRPCLKNKTGGGRGLTHNEYTADQMTERRLHLH